MEWWRNRIHCLFLSLFLWEAANAHGVWLDNTGNYWRRGDWDDRYTGTGVAAYAEVPAQPRSGGSVAKAPGSVKQYLISQDQTGLNSPQPHVAYAAHTAGPSNDVTSSGAAFLTQSSTNQVVPGFQSQFVNVPVSPSKGSASQYLSSQQSQVSSSLPQSLSSSYVFGTQTQPSSSVSSSQSSASDFPITSQQASYGFQSAVGTQGTQPSSSYFISQAQIPQTPSGTPSDTPVFPSQGLVGLYTSPQTQSQPGNAQYIPISTSLGSASQSSQQISFQSAFPSPGSSPLSQSFQSPYVSQPSSGVATTSQQASYGFQSVVGTQGSASQSVAPQQSLGTSALQDLPYSYVSGPQAQPSSGVATTPQQASSGVPSAAGTQGLVSGYVAGHAQWYRVGPFGKKTLLPLPGSASSNYVSTSQSQSSPGYFGFATQSQSVPASVVGLSQGVGQLPSTSSWTTASSSGLVSQPSQTIPSTSGQATSVATQQYSADASQSTGSNAAVPSQLSGTFPFGASTSAQGTSAYNDHVRKYISQAFGTLAWEQPAAGSSSGQMTWQDVVVKKVP